MSLMFLGLCKPTNKTIKSIAVSAHELPHAHTAAEFQTLCHSRHRALRVCWELCGTYQPGLQKAEWGLLLLLSATPELSTFLPFVEDAALCART